MLETTARPAPFALPLFVAALALQTLLLVWTPLDQYQIYSRGRAVTLATAPVDPFHLLSGYYVTLGYKISDADNLPGFPEHPREGQFLYVVLQSPGTPGAAWQPLRVSEALPEPLPVGQVALRGQLEQRRLNFGLETYYIPEDQRAALDKDLRDQSRAPALVDVRVADDGRAVPVRIRVKGHRYEYQF